MTTVEGRAGPVITAEAAAVVPPPLRRLLRVRKPWSAPLAFALTGALAIFSLVCWAEVAGRGRPPTWVGVGAIFDPIVALCPGIAAFQMLRDVGHRFRVVCRRVARTLLVAAHRERDQRKQSAYRAANNIVEDGLP